jgi:hypothetical protein
MPRRAAARRPSIGRRGEDEDGAGQQDGVGTDPVGMQLTRMMGRKLAMLTSMLAR